MEYQITPKMELTFNELPKAVGQLYEKLNTIEKLIVERGQIPVEEPDQLLTIQQAGDLLSLSVPTLYGYVQRNEIPFCKRGKRLYFSKHDLTNWVKASRRKTLSETAEEAQQFTKRNPRK